MTAARLEVFAYGDRAVLVQCPDLETVMALREWLETYPVAGQCEVVPAARTLLIRCDSPTTPVQVLAQLPPTNSLQSKQGFTPKGDTVQIRVVYDGPDLAEVARLTGLTEAGVVRAHTETPWVVAFTGFSPGFGYMTGGDPRLKVPRRSDPRSRLPAGTVGLADEFTGVYPRSSPGGWQLIGRTDAVMWDEKLSLPALLTPGTAVTFVQVRP